MAKRIMCLIISVLMIVSLLPSAAFATDETGEPTPVVESTADVGEGEEVEEEESGEAEVVEAAEATEETAVSAAAQAVQSMIDALPTVDEVAAMDTDGQNEVYVAFLAACEAYDSLTAEDQATVDDSALDTLADYFNGMVSTTDTFPTSGALTSGTYTLTDNVTLTGTLTVASGQVVTIDLNGYTISYTSNAGINSSNGDKTIMIYNYGTLNITDNSQEGNGKISMSATYTSTNTSSSSVYACIVETSGSLNLNGGTLELSSAYKEARGIVVLGDNGSVTVNGGNLSVTSSSSRQACYGIYAGSANAKVSVISGSVKAECTNSSNNYSVYALYGLTAGCKVSVSGGEIEASGYSTKSPYVNGIYGFTTTTVSGGKITVANNSEASGSIAYGVCGKENYNANITGGTITVTSKGGTAWGASYANISGDAKITASKLSYTCSVAGGTFNDGCDLNGTLAEGYTTVENSDSTYTVIANTTAYVAQNTTTSTKYESLSEAISAAGSGDTVQLLKDVELSSQITINSTVTLDLNGYTVSYPNNGDHGSVFCVNGSLTIDDSSENGTGAITTSSSDEFYAILVNSSGSLTVNKGTITSSNSDGNSGACGIKAQNSSTVIINGGIISGSGYGLYAAHASNVTINGGTIKSDTDSCYGVYLNGNPSGEKVTLIVNGGTISGCTGLYGQYANITITNGTISGGRLYGINVFTDCTVAVNGGTISSSTSTDTYSSAIYIRNNSTVSVSAGNITGQKYGICMVGSSELTLSGGSITGVTHGVFVYTSSATINVPASSTVTVKGTGTSALALKVWSNYTPTISIAGGHYSSVVAESYCADGYAPYTEAESTSYYTDGVPYTVKSTSFTLGVSNDSSKSVPATIASGEGEATMYVKVTSENIGSYTNAAYPTTSLTFGDDNTGYIFAGWYEDSEGTTTCSSVPSSDAYAKFVDANVLTVKAQIASGTTADSDYTNMRFVSTVDTVKYSEVGFVITIGGISQTVKSSTVYSEIAGGEVTYQPTKFSDASVYFITYTLKNIPNSYFNTDITVKAFWITQDGTTVYGNESTLKVSQGY